MSIDIAKPSDVLPVVPVHVFDYLCSTASEWICWGTLIFWSWHNNDRLNTDPIIWKKDEKPPIMHLFPRKKNWNMLFLLFRFKAFLGGYIFYLADVRWMKNAFDLHEMETIPNFWFLTESFLPNTLKFLLQNQSMQQWSAPDFPFSILS